MKDSEGDTWMAYYDNEDGGKEFINYDGELFQRR